MRSSTILSVLSLAVLTVGCESVTNETPANGIRYGTPLSLGLGQARTFYEVKDRQLVAVGVVLSEAALTGLPTPDGAPHGVGQLLEMPVGNPTPFQFLELNWNPGGHEPPGVYDRPHFDFHFWLAPKTVRAGIVPSDPRYQAKAETLPLPAFVPAGYRAPMLEAVPMMGVHWIDPTSPEFTNQGFSRTFIYGTWDGELVFAEPMITKAFIESKPNAWFAIPVPAKVRRPGLYPSAYQVRWDDASRQYIIALSDFVRR